MAEAVFGMTRRRGIGKTDAKVVKSVNISGARCVDYCAEA